MSKRTLRMLATIGVVTATMTPLVTHADDSMRDPRPPIADGLAGPLGLAVHGKNRVVVGEAFSGSLNKITPVMERIIASVPNGEVAGVHVANGGIYFTYTEFGPAGPEAAGLRFFKRGKISEVADLAAYEAANNPDGGTEYGFVGISDDCAAQLPPEFGPPTYMGVVESHPYAVALQRKTAYVADAAANAIIRVAPNGDVSTLWTLPTIPLLVTAEGAAAFGLPDCVAGLSYHFEAVPTDVELGDNNWLYVTTLPGGPEDPGFPARGALWRIHLLTGEVQKLADGLAGATDLAIGPNGTVWVTELFGGRVSMIRNGNPTPIPWSYLPNPAAIEYFNGLLYVAYDVFGPDGKVAVISR